MKTFKPILFSGLILLLVLFQACREELKIPNYEHSQPASIYALRRVQLSDGLTFGKTIIRAIVTSDIISKNISKTTLILQDLVNDAAIAAELELENTTIKMGDIVLLDLENTRMINKSGELTITGLTSANLLIESSNNAIPAKSTSIATLIKNAKYWGPIYVKLDKVNISKGSTNLLQGDLLIDDEIVEIRARFLQESVFYNETNPTFVQALKGVARIDSEGVVISPRNFDDIQIGLLELLEDFEQSANTNYDTKVMNFVTGAWIIDGGITATSASDPKNGKQSIRLQGTIGNALRNGIVAMNFDLKGIKTVSISHGIYPAAAELANVNPTTFGVEISKDGGKTYTLIGSAEVDIKSTSLKKTEFNVSAGFSEDVRLRIVNTSIPFTNNSRPRINIDDVFFKF